MDLGLTVRELCPEAPRWFALSVKYQHERRVETNLAAAGVGAFLPAYQLRRQWSDRIQQIEAPLFPGYVFGRFALREKVRVLKTPGVRNIVAFRGSPAPVADGEIAGIRAALESNLPVRPWPSMKSGSRVRVVRGPLRSIEGTLLRETAGFRLVLGIELLQRSVAVEVDPEMVVPVEERVCR